MRQCPICHSNHIVKAGTHRTRRGLFQMYKCQNCGRTRIGEKIA